MDVVMLISWSHYYNRRGMFMIEKLEEYGRFLFGWAFRAMQSEMTMQESLNAKSERAYLTGTEIALLEDSSLFIIGIGILVLMEAFFCCGSYILIAAWCDGADYTVPGRGV